MLPPFATPGLCWLCGGPIVKATGRSGTTPREVCSARECESARDVVDGIRRRLRAAKEAAAHCRRCKRRRVDGKDFCATHQWQTARCRCGRKVPRNTMGAPRTLCDNCQEDRPVIAVGAGKSPPIISDNFRSSVLVQRWVPTDRQAAALAALATAPPGVQLKQLAATAGVSTRTLLDWRKDPGFRAAFEYHLRRRAQLPMPGASNDAAASSAPTQSSPSGA